MNKSKLEIKKNFQRVLPKSGCGSSLTARATHTLFLQCFGLFLMLINYQMISKGFLIFALLVLNIEGFSWLGQWNVTRGCTFKDCCCPKYSTQITFSSNATNSSQIIATGAWSNSEGLVSEVCRRLGLSTHSSFNFPWGISSANLTNVYDLIGFGYSVYVSNSTGAEYAIINVNQTALKGDPLCVFQLSQASSSVETGSDLIIS